MTVTRPSGSQFTYQTSELGHQRSFFGSFTFPAADMSEVGTYTFESLAVDVDTGFAIGKGRGTAVVVDVATGIGSMTYSPANGKVAPGSRMTMRAPVYRGGGALPAVGVPVVWNVINPAGVNVYAHTSLSDSSGISLISVGATSLNQNTYQFWLQTATPGTYTVTADAGSGLVATGSFVVSPA